MFLHDTSKISHLIHFRLLYMTPLGLLYHKRKRKKKHISNRSVNEGDIEQMSLFSYRKVFIKFIDFFLKK